MDSKYIWFIILLISAVLGIGIYFYYTQNSNPEPEYNAARTSSKDNNTSEENTAKENTIPTPKTTTKETEVASFSTKIHTKDSERQNNISIACSTLNNTVISKGTEFSFSKTVGKATSSKGYEKADVYKDGELIQALGGGMCQISTTLYNAILKTSGTKVTERHEHSGKVPYIKDGKDAAVSYGTYDFKFKNNNDYDLKIVAKNSENSITIKIFKLEEVPV